jgi:hypothetical protein
VAKLEHKTDHLDEKAIEEEVKSARALIQTFLQAVKGYRLYDAKHPLLSKFSERITNDFEQYFSEFDSFTLQVGERQFFFRGEVVYETQDAKESLAFLFFKDGIREIQFFKGLEFIEIFDFLNILRKSEHVNRLEDDLVTLLWEKDFSHIAITTVDDFFEGSNAFIPRTEEELFKGLESRASTEEDYRAKASEAETGESQFSVNELKQALNPSPAQSLVQACQLNPDEMMEIGRELQGEQESDYFYDLVRNLVEILLHLDANMNAYENMISYFGRIIQTLLEKEEVGKVVAILKHLRYTMESIALKDKQILAINRILETSSDSLHIQLIGKVIKSNEGMNSETVLQYLRLLTKKSIDPLCHLLGELESEKWKKVVTNFLVELSRKDIHTLAKFLSDHNSVLVRQILCILEKVRHPSTVDYLENLVVHKDLKVRELTLHMVIQAGEKGKDLLQKFLRDPVPTIRIKASLNLARMAKDKAVKPLMEIILSEDFNKRDYEEKATFFKALGETGSKEVIPALKEIAKKRIWFKRRKWEEMRTCATNTLKMMGASR